MKRLLWSVFFPFVYWVDSTRQLPKYRKRFSWYYADRWKKR